MPNLRELENAMPVAPLKIVALASAEQMGKRVNNYLVGIPWLHRRELPDRV